MDNGKLKEFTEQMRLLASAYMNDRFIGEGVLKAWFKYFGEFESDIFAMCVDKWIRDNRSQPSISDLMDKCETEKRRRYNVALREQKERERAERESREEEEEVIERTKLKYDPDNDEQRATHSFWDGWRIDEDGYYIRVRI